MPAAAPPPAAQRRLAALSHHCSAAATAPAAAAPLTLTAETLHLGSADYAVNVEACRAFAEDPAWAGQPFWMLNLFVYHEGEAAQEGQRECVPNARAVQPLPAPLSR